MRKGDKKGTGNRADVIIRKEEVVEGEAHGGAWKVAYADFVTAMMAFFLLMWLLNATTEDQRKGLADYFSPNSLLSHASSGTGDPFSGHTAFDQGALVSDRGAVQVMVGNRPTSLDRSDADADPSTPARAGSHDDDGAGADRAVPPPALAAASVHAGANTPPTVPGPPAQAPKATAAPAAPPAVIAPGPAPAVPVPTAAGLVRTAAAAPAHTAAELPAEAALQRLASSPQPARTPAPQPRAPTDAELQAARERQEKAEFDKAAQQIRDAVAGDPALTDLARQLAIDMTPEGLRIQILDADGQPMFPLSSAHPNDRARLLLQKVTPVLEKLPQAISIAGYTDATPFPGPDRTNWELSAERANATRRLLVEGGLPDARIRTVIGHADRDPLVPSDPLAAANRRIAIVVLRSDRPPAPASPATNVPAP